MELLTVRAGITAQYEVALLHEDGTPVTSYTTADTLACKLWAGDATSTLATPLASWTDPSQGLLAVTFRASDTATLTPARYKITLELTHSGETVEAWRAWLEVLASPGSASAPKVYCTYDDLLSYAPRLAKEQDESTLAGFAEARAQARRWLENIILKHSANKRFSLLGGIGTTSRGTNPYIKTLLDTDKLIVSPAVVEITAKKALSIVYGSCVSPNDKGKDDYLKLSDKWANEANRLAQCLVAEFDTNGDGFGELSIDLSVWDVRY